MTIQALEFYSGIGAFAQAARRLDVSVLSAFDQSQWANLTYQCNYGHKPNSRNLDSISAADIPAGDLWWMSPPCTPFSRRGKQKDLEDNRARSFLHLIGLLQSESMQGKRPRYILIENVEGFIGSKMHDHLLDTLAKNGYQTAEFRLCSSMFGVPMLRPRVFIVAGLTAFNADAVPPPVPTRESINKYLHVADETFNCDPEMLKRYDAVLNIVDPAVADSYFICFTSGYHRCRQASGSLISTGPGAARFVAPQEILALLGFDSQYSIPETIPLEVAYKLVGNSVDVRAITFLLREVLGLK